MEFLNGGTLEWNIKNKTLSLRFITPNKNLIGEISLPNFDLDDSISMYN